MKATLIMMSSVMIYDSDDLNTAQQHSSDDEDSSGSNGDHCTKNEVFH